MTEQEVTEPAPLETVGPHDAETTEETTEAETTEETTEAETTDEPAPG